MQPVVIIVLRPGNARSQELLLAMRALNTFSGSPISDRYRSVAVRALDRNGHSSCEPGVMSEKSASAFYLVRGNLSQTARPTGDGRRVQRVGGFLRFDKVMAWNLTIYRPFSVIAAEHACFFEVVVKLRRPADDSGGVGTAFESVGIES